MPKGKRKLPTEAEKLFKQTEAKKQASIAWEILRQEQIRVQEKTARLRALRLARDAANEKST